MFSFARNTGIFKKEGKRKNSELAKLKEKINDYIEKNIAVINESLVLIFAEEEADSKQTLYKTIDKFGTVCKFEYQKPIQIEARLKAICNGYKVQIDNQSLRYFIALLFNSLFLVYLIIHTNEQIIFLNKLRILTFFIVSTTFLTSYYH